MRLKGTYTHSPPQSIERPLPRSPSDARRPPAREQPAAESDTVSPLPSTRLPRLPRIAPTPSLLGLWRLAFKQRARVARRGREFKHSLAGAEERVGGLLGGAFGEAGGGEPVQGAGGVSRVARSGRCECSRAGATRGTRSTVPEVGGTARRHTYTRVRGGVADALRHRSACSASLGLAFSIA